MNLNTTHLISPRILVCKLLLLLTTLSIAVVSCSKEEKDEFEQDNLVESPQYDVEILNYRDIRKNPKRANDKTMIKRFESWTIKPSGRSAQKNDTTYREVLINNEHFKIALDGITYVAKDDSGSYNFSIVDNQGRTDKVENLVLNISLSGGLDSYIVRYDFTEEEFKTMDAEMLHSRTTHFYPVEFDLGQLSNTRTRPDWPNLGCVQTWIFKTAPIDHGDLTGNFGNEGRWVLQSSRCSWSGGGGGTGNTSTPSGTDPGPTGGQAGGAGGQGDGPIISSPTFAPGTDGDQADIDAAIAAIRTAKEIDKLLGNTLSEEEKFWLVENPDFGELVLDFIFKDNTLKSKTIALEAIDVMMRISILKNESESDTFDPLNTPWLKSLRDIVKKTEEVLEDAPDLIKAAINFNIDFTMQTMLTSTAFYLNSGSNNVDEGQKQLQFLSNGKNGVAILLYEFANGIGKDIRTFDTEFDITKQMMDGKVLTDVKNDFLNKLLDRGQTYDDFVSAGQGIDGNYLFSPDHTTAVDSFNKHKNANWVQFFLGGSNTVYYPDNDFGWILVKMTNPTSRNSLLLHKAESYNRDGSGINKPLSTIQQIFWFKLKIK